MTRRREYSLSVVVSPGELEDQKWPVKVNACKGRSPIYGKGREYVILLKILSWPYTFPTIQTDYVNEN
jgi:hypothetical protein